MHRQYNTLCILKQLTFHKANVQNPNYLVIKVSKAVIGVIFMASASDVYRANRLCLLTRKHVQAVQRI